MEPMNWLDSVAAQRSELRSGMGALEQALAAPAGAGGHWDLRVYTALAELDHDLDVHVQVTEGPEGLYTRILADAPRLAAAVTRLTNDHEVMRAEIASLLELTKDAAHVDVDTIRDDGTELLTQLAHHRQRGSDLLYEAYQSDIGGET